jgi:hypothetical protein
LKRLRKEQKQVVANTRRELMKRRRAEAAPLPPGERRAFYRRFNDTVRALELAALADLHRQEALAFCRSKKPTWNEFLRISADAGDLDAARLIAHGSRRVEREGDRSAELRPQVRINPAPERDWPLDAAQPSAMRGVPHLSPEELLRSLNDYRAHGR